MEKPAGTLRIYGMQMQSKYKMERSSNHQAHPRYLHVCRELRTFKNSQHGAEGLC